MDKNLLLRKYSGFQSQRILTLSFTPDHRPSEVPPCATLRVEKAVH